MILTFSVSNFRSFNEEETFSLVASKKLSSKHENHLVSIPNTDSQALRVGVLYGANGAGKSNFFKALEFVKDMALYGRKKGDGTRRNGFRFNPKDDESSFDIQFVANETIFRYGFVLDDDQIIEEWLLDITGREKIIFERHSIENGGIEIKGEYLKGYEKLEALAKVGGPKEQTFLATIKANLEPSDIAEPIVAVLNWLSEQLTFVQPDSNFWPLGHSLESDKGFKSFASNFMRSASTGVDDLVVSKKIISEDELKLMLPTELFKQVVSNTRDQDKSIVNIADEREVVIEKGDDNHYYTLTIQTLHSHESSNAVHFDLSEESDGTKRLLNLLPALHKLNNEGGVFIIDEIERSMHPLLIYKFMEFFLSGCGGKRRQLIVTTHESNLLDQDLLRRDEIWFSEKNRQGATTLYSLSDFKERNDLKIDKHYLKGRFGAVPFLGDIDRLMDASAGN